MDEQVREGNGVSKGTHLWMSKSGREGTRASEWHSLTGKCRQTVKSGREGIGASKQHSPKDGQGREGIRASKGTHQLESRWLGSQNGRKWSKEEHSPMDEQVREEGNQSKQPSGTHQRMSKGGRDRSEQGHSPRMGKLGREGIRVSEQHSPIDGQVREGGNRSE